MYALIYSIIENNRKSSFKFYIINQDIPESEFFELNEAFKNKQNVKFINCIINEKINKLLNHVPTPGEFGKENYFRLFLNDFVDTDKIIYLDCDMIVQSSIEELWETNLNNYIFGAVRDSLVDGSHLNINKEIKYFNSGMLLINLKKWKENKIKENCLKYVKQNYEKIKYVDQDGLNYLAQGKWLELNAKFNNQLNNNILNKKIKPVIIHFNGGNKPWKFESLGEYKKRYWEYRNKTKFKRRIADNFSYTTFLKKVKRIIVENIILRISFKLKSYTMKIKDNFFLKFF